jgi:hypothetical protein
MNWFSQNTPQFYRSPGRPRSDRTGKNLTLKFEGQNTEELSIDFNRPVV